MRINSNISSLQSQRQLSTVTKAIARSMEKLSSGKRVNSARDDAAGLAIGNGLEAQTRGMLQAIRNMNEAYSYLQTADGTLQVQTEIVQRMRELSLQSANGTLGAQDRDYLNSEFQQLLNEFDRIAKQTTFNGTNLLDGSADSMQLQVGNRKGESFRVDSLDARADTIFRKTAGTGTFYLGSTSDLIGRMSARATIIDLNNDGHLDVLQPGVTTTSTIFVKLGNGDGTFRSASTISSIANTYSKPIVEDFNGDGYLDVVIGVNTPTLGILLGNGDGTFSTGATFTVGNGHYNTVTGDANNDGKSDILQHNRDDSTVSILLGNGNGTFASTPTIALNSHVASSSIHIPLFQDFTGDGKMDIIFNSSLTNEIIVRIGNGDGTFSAGTTISQSNMLAQGAALGDLNNDSLPDYALSTTTGIKVFLNNGGGAFTAGTTFLTSAGANPTTPQLYDFDGDGNLDLAARVSNRIYIGYGLGDGTFANTMSFAVGTGNSESWITLSDMDADGDMDIGVPGEDTSRTFTILKNNGGKSFSISQSGSLQFPAGGATGYRGLINFGDFNEDGFEDFTIAPNESTGTPAPTLNIMLQNTAEVSAVSGLTITSQEDAENVLEILDEGQGSLVSLRASLGAMMNRLESAISVSQTTHENLSQAKSRVIDLDIAEEMAEFTRLQVLQNAGVAVLGQANLSVKLSLKLLNFYSV